MIYKNKFTLLFYFVVFVLIVKPISSNQNFETIIGIVDGEVITSYELSQRIKILLNTLNIEDNIQNRDKVRDRVLQNIINDRIKIIEAKKMDIETNEFELQDLIANAFGVNPEKNEEFKNYLTRMGIDHDIILEQAKAEILWKKIVNARFSSLIVVSDDEIKKEKERYKSNIGMLQYNLSEIVILKNKQDNLEALKRIKQIETILRDNTNFDSVALKFSDAPSSTKNGYLGWVFADQIKEETKLPLEEMENDEISEIIEIDNGYKIIKLHDKRLYGENKNRKFDIVNISSNLSRSEFDKIKNIDMNCSEDLDKYFDGQTIKYNKIERINLEDFPVKIQTEINKKKEGQKTKVFSRDGEFFFFLICKIFGDETEEIDERVIDKKLYFEKMQQFSKTYLKRLNRNSNIKIFIKD